MALRFITAQFGHETNTFVSKPTRMADFRLGAPDAQLGSPSSIVRARKGTRTIHGGFIASAESHGVSLTPILATFAQPGGTSGREHVLRAYAEAVAERYRFFSYGDAMFLH